MQLKDWRQMLEQLPEDTPVVFYQGADVALQSGEYCGGVRVSPSRMWEGQPVGWVACVLVELGEAL